MVKSKLYNSKLRHNSIFYLILGPKKEKIIQIYLVISKTLVFLIRKKNLPSSDNFQGAG
jgi:hypothetical protein